MKLAALALLTTLGLGGVAGADPVRPTDQPRAELRQLLLERFDKNHDGQLDPKERRHAIRALRRIARRMAIEGRREGRGAGHESRREGRREARMRALVQRYDRNGDGVVTPDEMPPGAARRLQSLDRNGDGWLDERDER